MVPLLVGTDGVNKMSKSLGNYISMQASANDIYGGIMSAVDEVIIEYFKLLTRIPMQLIKEMETQLRGGDVNPMLLKKKLAYEVTKIYYDEKEARRAEEYFEKVVQKGETPDQIKEVGIAATSLPTISLLTQTGLATSNSQAKKLIEQGAVEINDRKIQDKTATIRITDGMVVKAGKRNFVRVKKPALKRGASF